jgi:hypothetical protein
VAAAEISLTDRQTELIGAFVAAWQATGPEGRRQPFVLANGPIEHPNWPAAVRVPSREEVRSLVRLGWLDTDSRAAPDWAVFPSPLARAQFGGSDGGVAEALSDADRRLGVILDATVAAHEADPSEPSHLASMDHGTYVDGVHWPIERDVVRHHDLAQLEDLDLVATRPVGDGQDLDFWPTANGRKAVKNPAAVLEEKALEAVSAEESSRLRRWADRFRAGDFAVSAAAGTASGAFIRALMGS